MILMNCKIINRSLGKIAKLATAADCKSAPIGFGGSSPSLSIIFKNKKLIILNRRLKDQILLTKFNCFVIIDLDVEIF